MTLKNRMPHKYAAMLFDLMILLVTDAVLLILYPANFRYLGGTGVAVQFLLSVGSVFLFRLILGVYRQVWHYADAPAYMKLFVADLAALLVYYVIQVLLPFSRLSMMRAIGLFAAELLITVAARMIYQYLYQTKSKSSRIGGMLRKLIFRVTGIEIQPTENEDAAVSQKTNIAIVGAGRVGVGLADELLSNPRSTYTPVCFIDNDREKIGRYISGIRVLSEEEITQEVLQSMPVQEIVFALPRMEGDKARELYAKYRDMGCRIKVYDFPLVRTDDNGKRSMREFDIEELLFRRPEDFLDGETRAYYKNKTVLISGGGGSIGSELSRQIARMQPKKLVILDVYENNAYDIQQELHIAYGDKLNLAVEIVTVCDREELETVFAAHRPDVVLHAAAHKHVPLMEHNCAEAVRNNVFGTLNMVELSEKYGVDKFIMISTDKAVNPTNVMGATKRVCEMIVQSHTGGNTKFSATRFGNVLGSNGSVIPLFRRQIAAGGPVTLTDREIVRYFMTIPEASQLVLTSGAMAKDGELFVLDMGQPVRILDLAENMIRLSGYEPYQDIDIVETGLRPGEKLYEELLVRGEDMSRTENKKIFIEKDTPPTREEIAAKLAVLKAACDTNDDAQVRQALLDTVPTYLPPEQVNGKKKG